MPNIIRITIRIRLLSCHFDFHLFCSDGNIIIFLISAFHHHIPCHRGEGLLSVRRRSSRSNYANVSVFLIVNRLQLNIVYIYHNIAYRKPLLNHIRELVSLLPPLNCRRIFLSRRSFSYKIKFIRHYDIIVKTVNLSLSPRWAGVPPPPSLVIPNWGLIHQTLTQGACNFGFNWVD